VKGLGQGLVDDHGLLDVLRISRGTPGPRAAEGSSRELGLERSERCFCGDVGAGPAFLTAEEFPLTSLSLADKQSDDFPAAMSGMSGSGIWLVGEEAADGRIVMDLSQITLDGVILRHSRNAPEFLRCHGRQSIYRFHDSISLLT
jgi:hypothetical protein